MKLRQILITGLLLFTGFANAQEGVSAKGNTLHTREIAPVWPGCTGNEQKKDACFQEQLIACIKTNYKFPRDSEGNFIRGKAVVIFNINKEGLVEILEVSGPKKPLNEEAKRVIRKLPKMKPGQLAGKPIAVKYTVPLTF